MTRNDPIPSTAALDLGELFRAQGVANESIESALATATAPEQSLFATIGSAAGEVGLDDRAISTIVAKATGVVTHNEISDTDIDEGFIHSIPIAYARSHRLIGLRPRNGFLRIVTDDPSNISLIGHIATYLGIPTTLELAPRAVVERAINTGYADRESDFSNVIEDAFDSADAIALACDSSDGDLLDDGSRAPVIKLVNMILFEAVKRGVSDVHIQPFPSRVQIRYRIDGVLYDFVEVPFHLLDEVVSRVKVIGKMDIAEKRLAQDGRTTVTVGERTVDLRISIIPTSCGERVVLRLLDKSSRLYTLPELGMFETDQRRLEGLLHRTHGIILVTGPTGSGKSTTLYAALQYLNSTEKNVLTLEDPIEYQIDGISQTQVSPKKGMTFATGLRTVLRQDPDIIMVGEIRDEETARMAVQSSLTGHLVFSTLHTNDAAGAVSRLLDLGTEPYLVASSLLAVLAQRLVRIVCAECATLQPLSECDATLLGLTDCRETTTVHVARGCDACARTGYRGRRGIFELLIVDESLRELIVRREKASAVKASAVAGGMTTLREDAIRKLRDGATTVEEVMRVTQMDEEVEGSTGRAVAVGSMVNGNATVSPSIETTSES